MGEAGRRAAPGEYEDGICLQRSMQRMEREDVLRRLFLLLDQLMGGVPSSFLRGRGVYIFRYITKSDKTKH